jgi:hypothetical protein
MTLDAITAVALFLAAQSGALIWFLSAINTKQADMGKTLDRVEATAHASALHVAGLPCHKCPDTSTRH